MKALKEAIAMGYSEKFLANELFPQNKYPVPAFRRILKGEGEINLNQAQRLASLLDVKVDDLTSGKMWKAEFRKPGLTLMKGAYRVEIKEGNMVKFYHLESNYYTETKMDENITLSSFIEIVNQMIENHE